MIEAPSVGQLIMLSVLRVLADRKNHRFSKVLTELRADLAGSAEGNAVLGIASPRLDDEIAEAVDLLLRNRLLVSTEPGQIAIAAKGLEVLASGELEQILARFPVILDDPSRELRSVRTVTYAETPALPRVSSNCTIVDVFFATDRSRPKADSLTFTNARSPDGRLTVGKIEVSIPRDHRLGFLEAPAFWRFEFQPDTSKHICLKRTCVLNDLSFFEQIAEAPRNKHDGLLVFIPGFNVTFEEAVLRAAQIAYDVGHRGPTMAFSWPSRGGILSYSADEATVEWTAPHLAHLLANLTKRSGLTEINIIAHSMGSRALLLALSILRPDDSIQIGEAVFAAPDVDRDVFADAVAHLHGRWRRATLYANSGDEALALSRVFHKAPRAGDSAPDVLVCSGLDSIDASLVISDLVGHNYFGDNHSIIADMFYLLRGGVMPRFRLNRQQSYDGYYWSFRP